MKIMKIMILSVFSLVLLGTVMLPPLPAQEMWLVWADPGAPGNPIFLSQRRAAAWTTEQYPGGGGNWTNYMPCLGIDGEGNPCLVWAAQIENNPARIYYSRRENGGWSLPRAVSGAGGGWESTPSIIFDRDGFLWIAWSAVAGPSSEIFCARAEGEAFTRPVMVSTPDDSPDARPVISLDTDGGPVVTWEGWTGRGYGYFSSRFREGNWSPEEAAARPGGFVLAPAAVAGAPLSSEALAEKGAWVISRDREGLWEAGRCRDMPTAVSPPVTGGAVPGGADGNHQYTGFGDSITYGAPDKHKCYIPLLKTGLESSYPGTVYTINNEGYPRARTYHLLDGGGFSPWKCPGIDAVLDAHTATIILIMAGTNDIEDGDNYSDISWNLGEMVDRSRTHGYEPILATIIPRWDSSLVLQRSQTLDLAYIRPLADEKNVRLADPWQVFIDYGNYGNLYESDHVHPKWTAGDQKIADAWFAAIPAPASPSEGGGLDEIIKWSEQWASGL